MEHKLIQGGERFLPFARSRIKAMRATGARHASQRFEVDGVSIGVRIDGEHSYIYLSGGLLYMESGVLRLLNTAPASADSYKPALVWFGSLENSNLLKQGTPEAAQYRPNAASRLLKGTGLEQTYTAAGCAPTAMSTTATGTSADGTVHDFISDPAAFCSVEDLRTYKQVMNEVPSSLYTGKLKLFVQALYGSKRRDYSKAIGALWGNLVLKTKSNVSLPINVETSGLLTVVDAAAPADVSSHTYFLINAGLTGGVTFRAMAKKKATAVGEPIELAEALQLSTLVPDEAAIQAVGPDLSTFIEGGKPLAYGWHFTKDGMKASAVFHYDKTVSGVKRPTGYSTTSPGTTIDAFGTKLITLNFSPTKGEDGAWSMTYTISVEQSGDYIPYLQHKLYKPSMSGFGLSMEVIVPRNNPYFEPGWDCFKDSVAPVYCYYDKTDALVVVNSINSTYSTTAPNTEPYFAGSLPGSFAFGGPSTESRGPTLHEYYDGRRVWGACGFSVGAAPYTVQNIEVLGASLRVVYDISGSQEIVFDSPGGRDVTSITSGINAHSFTSRTTVNGEGKYGIPVGAIPFMDASAFVAGKLVATVGTETSTVIYGFGNNVRVKFTDGPPPAYLVNAPYYPYFTWGDSLVAGYSSGDATALPSGDVIFNGSLTPDATLRAEILAGTQAREANRTFTCTMKMHAGSLADVADIYNLVIPDNGDMTSASALASSPYPGLFDPAGATNPFFSRAFIVSTSYSGKWYGSGLTPDGIGTSYSDWPETSFAAAVGWA